MAISKKIVMLGHFGVGKTSILQKYVHNQFSSDYKVSIGVHILKKEVQIGSQKVALILWDTEGTKDLNLINNSYLLGAHSFVLTYDITRPTTYLNLQDQIHKLKDKHPKAIVKVIGNKIDLISENTIKGCSYDKIISESDYLTSAKSGNNIDVLFSDLAKELVS